MPEAKTIDEVIEQLDVILAQAIEKNEKLGFFPALYRKVTQKVKEGIEQGLFEDGERMARLDVHFANRYLQAYERFQRQEPCGESWHLAFRSAEYWRPIVLQHILLGINAHINLDLGIAAAETVPPGELHRMENDFRKINDILNGLVNEVQRDLSSVWPWLKLIDLFARQGDEWIARFGINLSRNSAWNVAQKVSQAKEGERQALIEKLDKKVSVYGKALLAPPTTGLRFFFLLVRLGERKSVPEIINLLA